MINNKQKTLINDCYCRLGVLNNIAWTAYRDNMFDINRKGERKHRKTWDDRNYSRRAISVNDSARYFTCMHVIAALVDDTPDIESYIRLRKTIFYAHSLVANYRDEIEKSLDGFDLDAFNALDYADMVQS